jgi:hypothetical protein
MTKTKQPAKPEIYTDVYGTRAPAAARFGVGARDIAGAQEAADARRNAQPGDSYRPAGDSNHR